MQDDRLLKNKEICVALSAVLKEVKGIKNISTVAYESELPRSVIHYIDQASKDPQLTTFWRLAEGFNLKPHELLKMVEDKLPDEWKMLDD